MVDALQKTHTDKFDVSLRPAADHKDELKAHGIESHGIVVVDKAGETLWKHGDHKITQAQLDAGVTEVLGKLND